MTEVCVRARVCVSLFYNTLSQLLWDLSEHRPKSLLKLCGEGPGGQAVDLTPSCSDLSLSGGFVKPRVNFNSKRVHCCDNSHNTKCLHVFVLGLRRFIRCSSACQEVSLDECRYRFFGWEHTTKTFKNVIMLIYLQRDWFLFMLRLICIEEVNRNLARACVVSL